MCTHPDHIAGKAPPIPMLDHVLYSEEPDMLCPFLLNTPFDVMKFAVFDLSLVPTHSSTFEAVGW